MKGLWYLIVFMIAILATAQNSPATTFHYIANLDGPSESPPNASPGTGFAKVDYNDVYHTLNVYDFIFSDLLGTVTALHIHAPTAVAGIGTAGVSTITPTFTGFPLGVTSGSYSHFSI